MVVLKKAKRTLKRLKRDESGIAAISWAVSLSAIIAAMGAAMDFAILSGADQRSQTIADTTALAAAIYVKNYEHTPTSQSEGLIGEYTAKDLGYSYRNWVIDGAEGVSINVSYDDVNREATVLVSGQTRPTLMQILGYDALDFSAKSVVKYYEKDVQDPASVVLVLDNSGSMYFDDKPLDENGNKPSDAQRRIDGLETGAKNFMTMLSDTVGPQDGSQTGVPRVLRTGMMAFSSTTIASRTVNMDWDVVTDGEIEAMEPGGATNSAPPLVTANQWLNINEPPVHEAENPGKTPLKYIILMTDGKNTVGTEEWVAREGTENWRAWLPTETTTTEWQQVEVTVTVPATPGEISREPVNAYIPNANCGWENGFPRERYSYTYSNGYTGTWRTRWRVVCDVETEGTEAYETTELQWQEVDVTTTTWDWEYREQEEEPLESGDWEEGEFDISSNIATRAECDSLHAAGVEIFSVAFALEPGDYRTNDWGQDNYNNPDFTYTTTDEDANKARGILQYCASNPQNFITADDTEGLQEAFDRIGNTIIKEIIRISS